MEGPRYYRVPTRAEDQELIDGPVSEDRFYGSRKMKAWLLGEKKGSKTDA